MAQMVALVTGASSGIGLATAQNLVKLGFVVYAAARRIERLESQLSASLRPLTLDITSPASIRAGVEQIYRETGRLDVLVNNAGYGLYGVLEEVSPEEARRQFEINVFGLMEMTQTVLPIMRAQKSGRIINVSSVAGKFSTPMAGWYSASKHAVEALSDALRGEVSPFGIQVVIVEPGAIKTNFDSTALDKLRSASNLPEYQKQAQAFSKLVQNSYRNAPGPQVVARAIGKAATVRRPRTRYALRPDSWGIILLRQWLSDRMLDRVIASQLR